MAYGVAFPGEENGVSGGPRSRPRGTGSQSPNQRSERRMEARGGVLQWAPLPRSAAPAITELAEQGASDATVMALAGHLSRAMMEHYSHVRMEAKRAAVDGLATGLVQKRAEEQPLSSTVQ